MFHGLFDQVFDTVYDNIVPRKKKSSSPHRPHKSSTSLSYRHKPRSSSHRRTASHNHRPKSSMHHPLAYQPETLHMQTQIAKETQAYQDSLQGSGRDQYRSASAGRVDRYRPQSYQGGNYANSYDDYDDEYDRRDSRRSRSSKTKSTRSRSRSGIRGQLDKRFDKTERGLTSGALGALAGGLVGHEVGKGPLATVAGVVLGGLGANAFEARQERQKGREAQSYGGRRAKSTDARGGGYEKEEYYGRSRGSRGGDRDRGYDEYDSYSDEDDDRSPQRATGSDRKDRRQSKRAKDDEREEMEKHFGWAHTLRS